MASKSGAKGVAATSRRSKLATVNPQELAAQSLAMADVGWNNLEAKFAELQAMMSAPTSGLNAHQARTQQRQAVAGAIARLLDMAQQECRRLLIEGNAKAAVEGGLKTLKLKEDYYGKGSLQLVPAYFHLARTNQYMDKFKTAEEFLSLAQWVILKHPDADVALKAELHQTFGLLYASDSKLDAALKHLSCATYFLCSMNGTKHILTSFGYFDIGNVFAAKGAMENAMAFYDKVKDIWLGHLNAVLKGKRADDEEVDDEVQEVPYATPSAFGDENLQDAAKMLRGIVGLQTERFGRCHPSTGRAEQVLGLFFIWTGDSVSALDSLLRSLEIFKRTYGERHSSTLAVRSVLIQSGFEIPDDTTYVLGDVSPRGQEAAPAEEAAPAIKDVDDRNIGENAAPPVAEEEAVDEDDEDADEIVEEVEEVEEGAEIEEEAAAEAEVEAKEAAAEDEGEAEDGAIVEEEIAAETEAEAEVAEEAPPADDVEAAPEEEAVAEEEQPPAEE